MDSDHKHGKHKSADKEHVSRAARTSHRGDTVESKHAPTRGVETEHADFDTTTTSTTNQRRREVQSVRSRDDKDIIAMQESVRKLTAKLDKMKIKRKALELENEALKREMLVGLSPSSSAAERKSAPKSVDNPPGGRDAPDMYEQRHHFDKQRDVTYARDSRSMRPKSALPSEHSRQDQEHSLALELARERRRRRAAEEELLYEMDRNRGFQDLVLELRDVITRQQA